MKLERYFSVPLFREGLRRLALPAVGLGGVALVTNLLGLYSYFPQDWRFVGYNDYPPGLALCPVLLAYMMVAPLLLGLYQFRFLNRRDSADFFMAAPATRAALFNGFSLAGLALQWLTVVVVVATGAGVALGHGVRLHGADVLHAIGVGGVGVFLGWAITACAAAVSTGPLATAALAAIACFGPGLLQEAIVRMLGRASLFAFSFPKALATDKHLYFAVFNGAFDAERISGAGTLAYTLALAAGYYLLGWHAFARRHAESASAPGVLYPALAVAALFVGLSFFALMMVGTGLAPNYDAGTVEWNWRLGPDLAWGCGAVLLGFYLLGYVFFRRLRPLLFLTALLPLALAVAALATMGVRAWGERFRAIVPAADEVAAVTFLPASYYWWNDRYDFAGLRVTNAQVCHRAAASLARQLRGRAQDGGSGDVTWDVRLELRDGASLSRRVEFSYLPPKEPSLLELLMADPANAAPWRLPAGDQVCGFELEIGRTKNRYRRYRDFFREGYAHRGDAPQWETYRQEYAAAIARDPAAVASRQEESDPCVFAKFRDRHGRVAARTLPIVPRLMPQTARWLRETSSHPLPIFSEEGQGCSCEFRFRDLDSPDPDQKNGMAAAYYFDNRQGRVDSRFVAVARFLGSLQARQIAPAEAAQYHLAHCRVLTDKQSSPLRQGETEDYGGTITKHYFLYLTPEEIAKLRDLLESR